LILKMSTDSRSRTTASFSKFISYKRKCPFVIKVRTPCGRSAPLSQIFFCDDRHCMQIVHPAAAKRRIENYFCPHCLSTYPSNIVRKFTRCPKCICCPACFTMCEKILLMKKNTYLLQCTFCYWLSEQVGIKSRNSTELIAKVKERNLKGIVKLKEELTELKKHYQKNTAEIQPYINRKSYLMGVGGNWYGKKITMQVQRKIPDEDFPDQSTATIKLGIDREAACEKRDKLFESQTGARHKLPQETFENSWVKPADPRFISDFSLKRVTSLRHRLEDPVRQPSGFHKLHPQRMRLMTKESFQCPYLKCKDALLMKPAIGARHCSFEVKKLALDYLPHMRMDGPVDGWPNQQSKELEETLKQPVKLVLYFANSVSKPITLQITSLNTDELTNVTVSCSKNIFTIDRLDSSVRNVWDPLRFWVKELGSEDFTIEHVLGLVLILTPKSPIQDTFEFILNVRMTGDILCGDGEYRQLSLSYPLEITVEQPKHDDNIRSRQRRKVHSNPGSRNTRRLQISSGHRTSANT
jgi:hypothetical protein